MTNRLSINMINPISKEIPEMIYIRVGRNYSTRRWMESACETFHQKYHIVQCLAETTRSLRSSCKLKLRLFPSLSSTDWSSWTVKPMGSRLLIRTIHFWLITGLNTTQSKRARLSGRPAAVWNTSIGTPHTPSISIQRASEKAVVFIIVFSVLLQVVCNKLTSWILCL